MDFATLFLSLRPDQVALGAIVTIMVLGLLLGWVVPRSVLLARMADKDKEIARLALERDAWQAAYNQVELARQEASRQSAELIKGGETTNRLMESLRSHLENKT